MRLKSFLWVLLLGALLPHLLFADVTFTDEQYEELSQTIDALQQEQIERKNYEEDLKKQVQAYKMTSEDLMAAMQDQQSSYKKREISWITGSILVMIASSITFYQIGRYHGHSR